MSLDFIDLTINSINHPICFICSYKYQLLVYMFTVCFLCVDPLFQASKHCQT